jgi:hypothetical protein
LRAFQISTGSARFRELAFSNSTADKIVVIVSTHLTVDHQVDCSSIAISSPNLVVRGNSLPYGQSKFCKAKGNFGVAANAPLELP